MSDPCVGPTKNPLWKRVYNLLGSLPGSGHCPVVLPQRFVQLYTAPLPLGKVRLTQKPHHARLGAPHLRYPHERETQSAKQQRGQSAYESNNFVVTLILNYHHKYMMVNIVIYMSFSL